MASHEQLKPIIFLAPGFVPKTSPRTVHRLACRLLLLLSDKRNSCHCLRIPWYEVHTHRKYLQQSGRRHFSLCHRLKLGLTKGLVIHNEIETEQLSLYWDDVIRQWHWRTLLYLHPLITILSWYLLELDPIPAGHQSPRHLQDADVLLLRCPSSVAVVMQPITYLITVYKYSKQKH